jgi:dTDP-4-dehydrorhamnose reductase
MKFEPMNPAPPVTIRRIPRIIFSVTSLVIGASGLVGSALHRALGGAAVGTYRSRAVEGLIPLDARDDAALTWVVDDVAPRIVFFPAAEPNVDWCELHPSEAYAANVRPALSALGISRARGAAFVFFSSDYVFDGEAGPYDEAAPTHPLSVYADQKREVEERVLEAEGTVVRTTTVFGSEHPPGKNFVIRLVARLRSGEEATVPRDQYSTPTWSDELAVAAIAVAGRGGIWHAAGPDYLARDAFARLIADVFAVDPSLVRPVTTAELRQPARRPMRSGLRTEKLRRETGVTFLPLRTTLERFRDIPVGVAPKAD